MLLEDLKAITNFNNYVIFVDLDGTITSSRINNTYHFIMAFYKINRRTIGLLLFMFLSCIAKILAHLSALARFSLNWNAIFISMLFFGHNVNQLKYFSYVWYKILFCLNLININLLKVLKYLKKGGARIIMLTSCPELPAQIIADFLKFDSCLARRFTIKSNRIIGLMDTESVSMLKLKHLSQNKHLYNKKMKIYILDGTSAKTEYKILKFFDKIIIVQT